MTHFSTNEAVSFGWRTAKQRFWFFLQVILVMAVVIYGPSLIMQSFKNIELPTIVTVFFFFAGIVFWVIQAFMSIGLIRVVLAHVDGHEAHISDLFTGGRFLVKYIVNVFLMALFVWVAIAFVGALYLFVFTVLPKFLFFLLILVGTPFLFVFGIIYAVRLQFAPYLVIDKNLGPLIAIKESWNITRGMFWDLVVLALILLAINLLGIVALGVGLLWSIPTSLLVFGFVYRKLSTRVHA
ncbi:hypothetical protein BK004_04295 [bacterium CG10_46_32]|nr:MAG: hypothetical protein BK004_04295 [bacterium CG10_46_32]PIR55837.1 MAG: hypothetical protein COU73_04335 [Parcubacteria group bacterium CG10_big_fil_rev_8_21_14_0_10_46_32]